MGGPLLKLSAKVRKLNVQKSRLQGVNPKVPPNLIVNVGLLRAVVTQDPNPLGKVIILDSHKPSIPKTPKVLRGEEGETSDLSKGANSLTPILRSYCLRGILDDYQALLPCQVI